MSDWQEGEEAPKKRRSFVPVLVLLLLAAAGGVLAWKLWGEQGSAPTEVTDAGPQSGLDGGAAVSLVEGDALLRKLAGELFSAKEVAGWLAGDDILRQLTAAVNLVAEGQSPREVLLFLRPAGDFSVSEKVEGKKKAVTKKARTKRRTRKGAPPPERKGRLFIAPESYARYDLVTRAFTSVDLSKAGAAYAQLRPYFQAAFAEIGRPGRQFDDVLTAAIRRLTSVELPEGEVEVIPQGAMFAFKDPKLEALSAAEKHLLRMGAKNAKAIQETLKGFASAAGLASAP